jgi:Retinal pigment epithelial membrane protein
VDEHVDFDVINPEHSTQKHRYIYMEVGSCGTGATPPQVVVKFDTTTFQHDTWMPKNPYEFCIAKTMKQQQQQQEAVEILDVYCLYCLMGSRKKVHYLLLV